MIPIKAQISQESMRLDHFLALHFPEYTRTFLKKLILLGKVERNSLVVTKASSPIVDGDTIAITEFELPRKEIKTDNLPNFCANHLVFEHEHFLVVDKPSGLITHQPEHASDTVSLADILAAQRPEIALIGPDNRHGIVHRLDRDTSGLLIIARTEHGYATFTELFKNRDVKKTYIALVSGHPISQGSITASIMRHPSDPRKMSCTRSGGRESLTDYEVIQHFEDYSVIHAYPRTGRTHQIRVHLASIGHPVLGDYIYGTKTKLIKRHALHAHRLEFEFDGQQFTFESPVPKDIQKIIPK